MGPHTNCVSTEMHPKSSAQSSASGSQVATQTGRLPPLATVQVVPAPWQVGASGPQPHSSTQTPVSVSASTAQHISPRSQSSSPLLVAPWVWHGCPTCTGAGASGTHDVESHDPPSVA